MLFAATITDRGLLSAQTRDANMIGPQSYITTRLSYIPVPLPKDRHEECKQICFKETRWMWKVFFYQTSQFEEKFSLLLDAVYQKCPKGHMLHDDMVIFPDGLEWNTEEDKDVFPNEYELKFVEQTRVNKTPALLYFRELAKEYNLTAFCDRELILFIQRILPIYCNYESALDSLEFCKQYDARIAKEDCARFHQQAVECAEMYIYLSTIKALRNTRERSKSKMTYKIDEEKIDLLQTFFQQHHSCCCSCRSQDQNDSVVEDFCYAFSEQVLANWTKLLGNPFLIFRLWTTIAQSPFARESTDSLSALLDRRCRTKQTWQDPKVEEADRKLYNRLLDFCLPGEIKKVWKEGYWKLLENDGRSGVPITELCRKKAAEHIDACLPFEPIHLYKCYSRLVIENEELCHWLEQNPPVLERLNHYLNDLTVSIRKDLQSLFRKVMEKPSVDSMDKWLTCVMSVVETLPWQELSAEFPPLKVDTTTNKKVFTKFLISWILLQQNIMESKEKLRGIFFRFTGISLGQPNT